MSDCFADTTRGAHASAVMYSLIETAKANDLEPRAYLLHVLESIGSADTVEKLEALLPWNVGLPRFEENVAACAKGKYADLAALTVNTRNPSRCGDAVDVFLQT